MAARRPSCTFGSGLPSLSENGCSVTSRTSATTCDRHSAGSVSMCFRRPHSSVGSSKSMPADPPFYFISPPTSDGKAGAACRGEKGRAQASDGTAGGGRAP